MSAPKMEGMSMSSKEPPSREKMFTFLKAGLQMMEKEETREFLKDPKKCPDPGKTLIELQRKEWDPVGVDRDTGCAALDGIQAADKELSQARQEFVNQAMRTYLQALEDRKPAKLEKKKPMPKSVIIAFFDACNTKMDLPEMRVLLFNFYRENKQVPNQLVIDMQRDLLETFGFEREHGCRMLSQIGDKFPNDQELHQRMMYWQQKAQEVTMQCMKYAGAPQSAGAMPLMAMLEQSLTEEGEQELVKQAEEEIKAMSGEEQEELVSKMQKKMEQSLTEEGEQELVKQAEEEIKAMSGEEQEELVSKMQKKMETLMKLPEKVREDYMKKLVGEEKLNIMKSKMIMLDLFKKRMAEEKELWEAGGREAKEGGLVPTGGAEIKPKPMPVMAPPSAAAPSQMEM